MKIDHEQTGLIFVLSGSIMSHGAIAGRLVAVARAVFAPLPGGLGIATVAACMSQPVRLGTLYKMMGRSHALAMASKWAMSPSWGGRL